MGKPWADAEASSTSTAGTGGVRDPRNNAAAATTTATTHAAAATTTTVDLLSRVGSTAAAALFYGTGGSVSAAVGARTC
jgi:hypothetical protein